METRLEVRLRNDPFYPYARGERLRPCEQPWAHPHLDPLKTLADRQRSNTSPQDSRLCHLLLFFFRMPHFSISKPLLLPLSPPTNPSHVLYQSTASSGKLSLICHPPIRSDNPSHQPLWDLHKCLGSELILVNTAWAPVEGQALWVSSPAGCPARPHADRPSALGSHLLVPHPGRAGLGSGSHLGGSE